MGEKLAIAVRSLDLRQRGSENEWDVDIDEKWLKSWW